MYYKLNIPFEKKSKYANKSSFAGNFKVYFDEAEIFDIDVELIDVKIDCMSTSSHFEKKDASWRFKEKFLKSNNLPHIPRPKGQNYIVELDSDQKKSLSHMYNTWRTKNNKQLTIKQVDSIISGSNPSGEIKNPKSSSFKMTGYKYENFAIALKLLWNQNRKVKEEYKSKWSKEITLEEYFEKFPQIEKIFCEFQESHTQAEYKIIKEYVEKELTKYKTFNIYLNELVKKQRNEFKEKMQKSIWPLLKIQSTEYYYKAHIKPVAHTKRDILQNWKQYLNKKLKILKKLSEVADVNNGIFLPNDDHRDFDNGKAFITSDLKFINDRLSTQRQLPNLYNTPKKIALHKNSQKRSLWQRRNINTLIVFFI